MSKNIFVIGNSITLGFITHGMASTNEYSDYYYHIKKSFLENGESILIKRSLGTSWESGNSITRQIFLDNDISPLLSGHEDIIIIQLGDNVDDTDSLKSDIVKMLEWFKNKCPNSQILWVFGWFHVTENLSIIKDAVSTFEFSKLVDISEFSIDPKYKSSIGSTYINQFGVAEIITTKEVANHPGDLGMRMIAYKILKELGINISLVTSIENQPHPKLIQTKMFDINGNKLNSPPNYYTPFIIIEQYSDQSIKILKNIQIND